jgi:hypothetical protein
MKKAILVILGCVAGFLTVLTMVRAADDAGADPKQPSTQPTTQPAPVAVDEKLVADLVRQLGDDHSTIRDRATQKLLKMGRAIRPLLEAKVHEKGVDPEVAARIGLLLKKTARRIQMTYTGGWGTGVLRQFKVDDDGTYTWLKGKGARHVKAQTFDKLTGKLDQKQFNDLLASLSAARGGPGSEDAGYVEFEFTDADGNTQKREYSSPSAEPAVSLMAEIDALAAKAAKGPMTTTTAPV